MSDKERIQGLLYQKEFKKVERIICSMQVLDADLMILNILIQVFYQEEKEGLKNTVFCNTVDMDMLAKHFIKVKLLLRRLEFDLPEGCQEDLRLYCTENNVSKCLLAHILVRNIFEQKKVCRRLAVLFPEQAGYFRQICQHLEGERNG